MRIRSLLFVLLMAATVLGCRGESEENLLPTVTPFAPDTATEVHSVRNLAAEARDLEGPESLTEGTITREQLAAYYDAIAAETREEDDEGELEVWNTALRLMQMLGPDEDLLDEYVSHGAEGVVGLYSFEDDTLFLISDDGADSLDLDDRITLAHEYVHSFQDAAFDIDHLYDLQEKEEEDKLNTEYGATIDALLEGDAQAASLNYVGLELGEEEFVDWLNDTGGSGGSEEETALDRMNYFPYREGLQFVLYLWWKGGWEQVNKAYEDPPKTTEQILHPERYLAHDEPLGLKLADLSKKLGDGWEQSDDSLFGEFDVYNYVRTRTIDDSEARRAADGWNGGRIAIYTYESDPNRVLLHLVLSWDDGDEAEEFYTSFDLHVQSLEGAQHPGIYYTSIDMNRQTLWDGEGEHVYAWLEGNTFRAIFTVNGDDLKLAMPTVDEGVTWDDVASIIPPIE